MSLHNPALNAPAQSLNTVDAKLRAATRRIRLLMLMRYASLALCIGAGVGLLVVGLSKLRLFETPEPVVPGAILGLSLLIAAIVAFARPLRPLDVARLTERRADLKERISSAVEFREQGVDVTEPFYTEQFTDAEQHAVALDLRKLYPMRLPRAFWGGLVATLALFLLYFLPTLPAFWTPQQKKDAEDVKKQGVAITKLAKDVEKDAEQKKLDETKKAAGEARKIGEAMRRNKISKKEALVQMQKLTKKMQETQKKMAEKLPAKSMDKAHDQYKKSLEKMQREIAESRQQKKLAATDPQKVKEQEKSLKEMENSLQQMEKAMQKQDQQEMQKAMEELAKQMQSGQMSKEQMQQMQKAMEELSKSLQDSAMQDAAKQLQQLAQQMQQMQSMQNLDPKLLEELAKMMQKAGQCMGNCPGGNKMAQMDAEALKQLLEALKNGKMQLGMGKNGNIPLNMPGMSPSQMKSMQKSPFRTTQKGKGNGIGSGSTEDEMTEYLKKLSKNPPNTKAAGKRSGPSLDVQITLKGDPDPTKSATPYYQVYQSSKKAAETALDKENIPAAYKEQVKEYFDSIRP
jgi:hypothetical protein